MDDVIGRLRDNIARVRLIGGLHESLCQLTTPVLDCTDILRAQIVLAVSALDHYIHDVTRVGMLESYQGTRPRTDAFYRFDVSLQAAINGLASPGTLTWFEGEIRERHGHLSFEQPDKIADALRLFSDVELWNLVAGRLGIPVRDVKTRLQLIVDRRNKIAHEADLDPSYLGSPGIRWPISIADASNAVDFIDRLCEAIHSVVI